MSPTMASENPKLQTSSHISTPIPTNNVLQPRRSRPKVREVSSRFMSPAAKPPIKIPSTPSESLISKTHSVRRSKTDFIPSLPRYADENRPDSLNRSSVSPVRSTSKPRAAIKLFKEGARNDTPIPMQEDPRLVRQRSWDSAASKLLQASGISSSEGVDRDNDGGGSVNGDCDSVKSDPNDNHSNNNNCSGNINCQRISTMCSRSAEFSFPSYSNEQQQQIGGGHSVKGGAVSDDKLYLRSVNKVARSLNLPPMPPGIACSRPQGAVEVKKAVVRKGGSSQLDDAQRLKLLHNQYLQWRFANAKAEACTSAQKRQSEKLLHTMGVKISELQDSVKSKRVEVGLLKEAKIISTILDTQVPYLDEWSTLEEAYCSALLELTRSLQNISSRLPFNGNVKVDIKEINVVMTSALKVAESICLQVQDFVPKAEQVDDLISDLARVYSGEVTLVQECGALLSMAHLSQIEECSLRGQLMQF